MRLVITFIVSIFLLNVNTYTQNVNSNKEPYTQKGSFICRLSDNIIYYSTEEEEEFPAYKLHSLNILNNKCTLIDSLVPFNCWVKTSDSTILFAISNKLYIWNANTNLKEPFLHSIMFNDIVAIGYNRDVRKLIIFEFDIKGFLKCKIIDEFSNNSSFDQKIELNISELEGVYPKIESTNNFFIFNVQNNLYVIEFSETSPILKLVSSKCDGFALNEENSILFYEFISNERTTGYLINLRELITDTIDKELDEKIFNCSKLNLFSSQINGKNIPAYLVCDNFYLFAGFKWLVSSDAIIYKDRKLKVSLLLTKDIFVENSFEWIKQD